MTDYRLKLDGGYIEDKLSPLSLTHSWQYVKRRPLLLALLIVLSFGSPFLGLVLAGIPGVLVGLVVAVIGWVLGPRASERIIERRTRELS
jgi:hypothetical protein